VAGARRSIYDPRGNRLTFYAWGLGNISNNLTKAYSLWMVLCITKEEGFKKKLVLGDSMMIIRAMINQVMPGSNSLISLIRRIKIIVSWFDNISFFHIK
jgi:hypothetical protein